ncbi:FtsX-like permease family protein [Cellulomonas chengniuliangii]|uniref:ABC3 transporter permease C-terminal domain-containing protein n=1 Tax=Cellulomonas chengniuliangii TaxID=2968084 RepID=A0ABY5L029_9CELL|nr:FtsX-like permease family protein [Cellulomonas chengniuliangii]MCC2307074.1 hypothetical protein [Cellulomonas chengniuliangii]UUI76126.1 hypothetical protein NP064_04260 [Cellulomonas chengniuliangii]
MRWATRLVLRRAATQRVVLAAVLAVAVVGAGLLGTFALLVSASDDRAVTADLARRPASELEVEAVLTIGAKDTDAAIEGAAKGLTAALGGMPAIRHEWLTSVDYRFPSPQAGSLDVLLRLAAFDGATEHARLVAGSWPSASPADRIEVAVPRVAADELGLAPGTAVSLRAFTSRDVVDVVVVGVYEAEHSASYWSRDPMRGRPVDRGVSMPGSFGWLTTDAYGALLTTPAAIRDDRVTVEAANVVLRPDVLGADGAQLAATRAHLQDGQVELARSTASLLQSARFASGLPAVLDGALSALAVTRVALTVLGLMLLALCASVLQLGARLLTERRTGEAALLTSRGASRSQLVRLGALEAAGIAAVTIVAAPWVARGLYGLLAAESGFTAAGLDADPGLPASVWLTCSGAALLFAAVLVAPLLRGGASVVDSEQSEIRQDRRTMMTRSGIDLALVALAVVAFVQLRQYRSPVLRSGGVDPVLVAGPALFLLAGAALALRLLPLVAGLAERRALRSRSLAAPLASWEVGRRPRRAAGAVLVLTLAVAIGVFAQSFLATWSLSQSEQAAARVGSDLRVERLPLEPFEQSSVMAGLEHVGAISPVLNRTVALGRIASTGPSYSTRTRLVAMDASMAESIVRSREDTSDWAALLRPAGLQENLAVPLSPGVRSLSAVVTGTGASEDRIGDLGLKLTVMVMDAHGITTTAAVEGPALVPLDGEPQPVTLRLLGDDMRVAEPLSLVGFFGTLYGRAGTDYDLDARIPGDLDFEIAVSELAEVDSAGAATPIELDLGAWSAQTNPDHGDPSEPVQVWDGGAAHGLGVRYESPGYRYGTQTGFAATATSGQLDVLPALATQRMLDREGLEVGDTAIIGISDVPVRIRVERALPEIPAAPGAEAVLVDRTALVHALAAGGAQHNAVDEWWAEAADDHASEAAAVIREKHAGTAEARVDVEESLSRGPLRLGVTSALLLITLAAVALAVAGLTMSATVSVRQRRLELARLQALGAARSTLVRSVLAEHSLLVLMGMLGGGALGALMARLVAPLLTLGANGRPPTPTVQLVWAWTSQTTLLVTLAALLAVAVTCTATALMRRASAELLRLGDDR